MDKRVRLLIIFGVWVLGVGSCLVWGREHVWVAGLSVMAISASMFGLAASGEVSPREKQQYQVGGAVMMVFGLLLLYIGIKNP